MPENKRGETMEWIKKILYGINEGITEWKPVSSAGALSLAGQ